MWSVSHVPGFVLVTLWTIDDEASLLFMRSFYPNLRKGKMASAASYQSIKSLRESEDFCEIRYGAPFQLIGDDVNIEFKADGDFEELTVSLSVFSVLLLA